MKGIPSMRIAVADKCNLDCEYCPVAGDSYALRGRKLSSDEFKRISRQAHKIGVRHYSLTGGEPLLVPELTFDLAKEIKGYENLGYLRLNTNGTLISEYIENIKGIGFDKVKVSLDSLSNEDYSYSDCDVDKVLEGLDLLKEGKIPTRIDMVVGERNENQVMDMIQFCQAMGFELKLFELTYFDNCKSIDKDFWSKNFRSLAPLSKELRGLYGEPIIVYSVGGYGIPMEVFNYDTISPIRLLKGDMSAHYSSNCESCKDYKCQEGYNNIYLTADGLIKPCRSECNHLDLRTIDIDGQLLSDEKIRIQILKMVELFRNAQEKKNTIFIRTNPG